MKQSPAIVVQDPKDARDLPAIGNPVVDMWTVHSIVGSDIYTRQVEAYGYVLLYTDLRFPKGILWVTYKEYEVLLSWEPKVEHEISPQDIADELEVSRFPELKVVGDPPNEGFCV